MGLLFDVLADCVRSSTQCAYGNRSGLTQTVTTQGTVDLIDQCLTPVDNTVSGDDALGWHFCTPVCSSRRPGAGSFKLSCSMTVGDWGAKVDHSIQEGRIN